MPCMSIHRNNWHFQACEQGDLIEDAAAMEMWQASWKRPPPDDPGEGEGHDRWFVEHLGQQLHAHTLHNQMCSHQMLYNITCPLRYMCIISMYGVTHR
jgi:hypothetical protein